MLKGVEKILGKADLHGLVVNRGSSINRVLEAGEGWLGDLQRERESVRCLEQSCKCVFTYL